MNAPSLRRDITPTVLLLALGGLVVLRLWTSLCFFPFSGWNNIRLEPSFMLRFGPTPYPGLNGGPITTWIYGPVSLFINLPATLAHDTATALLIAGAINLLIAASAASLVFFIASPSRQDPPWADRAWAFAVCLALWPNSSLQYIQADNTAIAFGLLANLLLFRGRKHTWIHILPAAFFTALAVWSKQTALGLILAQVLWLGVSFGRRAAVQYTLACAACGLALGGVFVAGFGFDGLWLNLVQIPTRIPLCESLLDRTVTLLPHLAGYVILPVFALAAARRTVWRRDSPWLLPALTWLCLLPSSLVSIYKIGGNANSLNGFLYLLLPAALALTTMLRSKHGRTAGVLLATGVAAALIVQMSLSPARPLRPLTASLHQADYLARQFPGHIYFPWFPLVTHFSEHRFYHVEDGLYTRYTAQREPTRSVALQDLPEHWSITAFLGSTTGPGIIAQLQPSDAQKTLFGGWTVYSWTLPVAPTSKP